MESGLKILFTFGGFYNYETLFNHTTFKPILSGATGTFNNLRYWIRARLRTPM
jgi:hypothetical protein